MWDPELNQTAFTPYWITVCITFTAEYLSGMKANPVQCNHSLSQQQLEITTRTNVRARLIGHQPEPLEALAHVIAWQIDASLLANLLIGALVHIQTALLIGLQHVSCFTTALKWAISIGADVITCPLTVVLFTFVDINTRGIAKDIKWSEWEGAH